MSFFPVLSGDVLPLKLQLGGGETGFFPQARVYNVATNAEVTGSPVNLTHVALGLYSATIASLADAKYIAVYRVYTDAGRTLSSGVYPNKATDNFEIKSLEAKDATVAKASVLGSPAGATLAADIAAVKVDTASALTKLGTPAGASLSADVAAVKTVVDATSTKIGTPVATIATDIAGVQTSSNLSNTKLGTPAGASVSADMAAVKTVVDATSTKIGTPAATIAADIAAVKTDTNTIITRVGNPVGSSISADVANVQSTANTINTKLGTPAGATVSADIASVKADDTTLLARLTAGRAANLDNLDTAVSLVQTKTIAASQTAAIESDVAGVLAAVTAIQNNTDFQGIVPDVLAIPASGTSPYKFFANLSNDAGSPADPDSNLLNYAVAKTDGTVVVATTPMTRTGVGLYQASYPVLSTDTPADLVVTFTYAKAAVSFTQRRTTRVQADDTDLAILLSRLTDQRAQNLDFLDAAITSRVSDANDLTRYNTVLASEATTQAAVAGVQTKLGTPNAASVSLDIAAVRVSTDKIGAPAHGTLAADHAVLETRIGAPVTSLAADVAAVKAVDDIVNAKLGVPDVSVSSDIAAIKAVDDSLSTRLGTPVVSVAADLVAIKAVDDSVSSRIGTPVVSVAADIAAIKAVVDTVDGKLGTPAVTVSADLASVKSDTAGLRADYTTARAGKLDHLDVDTSSRQAETAAATRYNTLNANDVGILSAIATIQNNTSFSGIVPSPIDLPQSGTVTVRFFANLFNSTNQATDPDGSVLTYRIETVGGLVIVATAPMVRDGVGQFHVDYTVNATDPERTLNVIFEYVLNAVDFKYIRPTSVTSAQSNLDTLVDRLTEQRALNLDFLDLQASLLARQADLLLVRAKTDTLPSDFSDVARKVDVAAQAKYVNRMSTSFNNLTGVQEVLVWAEKNGQLVAGTLCSISVKDDAGTVIWSDAAAAPNGDGVFLFSHAFGPTADGNYYISIQITADGVPRVNKQPFVAVG